MNIKLIVLGFIAILIIGFIVLSPERKEKKDYCNRAEETKEKLSMSYCDKCVLFKDEKNLCYKMVTMVLEQNNSN